MLRVYSLHHANPSYERPPSYIGFVHASPPLLIVYIDMTELTQDLNPQELFVDCPQPSTSWFPKLRDGYYAGKVLSSRPQMLKLMSHCHYVLYTGDH